MQGELATFGDQEFEQAVRVAAYHLWERDGRPEGSEKHYWFKALQKTLRRHEEQERLTNGPVDPM